MASLRTTIIPFITLLPLLFISSEASDQISVGGNKVMGGSLITFIVLQQVGKINPIQRFRYDPNVDSVLHVTKEDYETCNNVNPIKKYDRGLTKIELDTAGTFYFIGVSKEKCNENGQKLILVILSDDLYSGRQSSPSSNADWLPKLRILKPSLPQTEDTPPISLEPAPAPVAGAHGLKGGFMGILMGVVGFLVGMVLL